MTISDFLLWFKRDCWGYDIAYSQADNKDACAQFCKSKYFSTPSSAGFVYDESGKHCWCKSKVTPSSMNEASKSCYGLYHLVGLYEDCDFMGRAVLHGEGNYDMNNMGLANDTISSIVVPKGYSITVYEHSGFQGFAHTMNGPTMVNCLSSIYMRPFKNWKGNISSFKITRNPLPPHPTPVILSSPTPPPKPPPPRSDPIAEGLKASPYAMSDLYTSKDIPFTYISPSLGYSTVTTATPHECMRSCATDNIQPSLADKLCAYTKYTNASKQCKKYYVNANPTKESALVYDEPTAFDTIAFTTLKTN